MKPPRTDAKNMHAITALFDIRRPIGLRLRDVTALLPDSDPGALQASLIRMVQTSRLFRAGVSQHFRYFLTVEDRDAAVEAVAAEHERYVAEQGERRRQQYRDSQRKRRDSRASGRVKRGLQPLSTGAEVVIERNPPPIKAKPSVRPTVLLAPELTITRSKDAPPQPKQKPGDALRKVMGYHARAHVAKPLKRDAEVIIPPHVQIQRLPGYVGDMRIMVPDESVVGGFRSLGVGRYLEATP